MTQIKSVRAEMTKGLIPGPREKIPLLLFQLIWEATEHGMFNQLPQSTEFVTLYWSTYATTSRIHDQIQENYDSDY